LVGEVSRGGVIRELGDEVLLADGDADCGHVGFLTGSLAFIGCGGFRVLGPGVVSVLAQPARQSSNAMTVQRRPITVSAGERPCGDRITW
jgi:hypothetical protein